MDHAYARHAAAPSISIGKHMTINITVLQLISYQTQSQDEQDPTFITRCVQQCPQ